MDLRRYNKILIFGGSFDPPQVAHVTLPLAAMRAASAQAVVYVPAGRAPHKLDRTQTPAHHRLAMLRLALTEVPEACILTEELDRAADGRPSYTVDTLESLRRRLGPDVQMRLLMGSDQVRIFPQWWRPERIVELAEPLVMVRPPDTRQSVLASLPEGCRAAEWEPRLLELPSMDVSATDVRGRVAAGQSIKGLVAPAVEEYIRREGLYGGERA